MRWLLAAVLLFSLCSSASGATWHAGTPVHAAFKGGGKIILHLGSGDATVVGKPDGEEIIVSYEAQDESKLKNVKTEVNVSGTTASIRVSGPHNNFHYTVTIPAREDLTLRMTAGDLSVQGVDGPLDIELHAGDCNVKLGAKAEDYGPVDLSNTAGDLNAAAFGAAKGGLFRHFKLDRSAKYRLHVHLGAGDLNID